MKAKIFNPRKKKWKVWEGVLSGTMRFKDKEEMMKAWNKTQASKVEGWKIKEMKE